MEDGGATQIWNTFSQLCTVKSWLLMIGKSQNQTVALPLCGHQHLLQPVEDGYAIVHVVEMLIDGR